MLVCVSVCVYVKVCVSNYEHVIYRKFSAFDPWRCWRANKTWLFRKGSAAASVLVCLHM